VSTVRSTSTRYANFVIPVNI